MRRPLIPVLTGIISGVWIESRFRLAADLFTIAARHKRLPFALLGIFLLFLCVWAFLFHRRHFQWSSVILILLMVAIGTTRYAAHRHLPEQHIAHFVMDEVVTVEGMLYRPVESDGDIRYKNTTPNKYLYLNVTWLEREGIRHTVCGRIRITLVGSGLPQEQKKTFQYGDVIKIRLRLRQPHNFGKFDYQEYLRRQGIYLIGTVKHDRYIIRVPLWQGNTWLALIYSIRQRIRDFFTNYSATYDGRATTELQVLQAMTLGTSRELPADVQKLFRNAGLYHLLVVSGVHIGIVAGVLHYLLKWCRVPLRYRIVGVLPPLLLYAGLSGFHFPVLRAVIMAAVLYFAITCNRVADALYSLGFAATVLVVMFPDALFDVGFQMTVAATASILGVYRCCRRTRWWEPLQHCLFVIRIPLMTVLVTCGAMIGIAPLMIYYFQELSPYSPLSNIVAFILITPLLPLALMLELLSLLVPWKLLYPAFSITVWLVRGLVAVAKWFPPLPFTFFRPHPLLVWGYYGTVVAAMWWFLHSRPHYSKA